MNCGVGRRHGLDPELLWLWHRPEAVAQIRPLAWEPPYAKDVALKKKKKEKSSGRAKYHLKYSFDWIKYLSILKIMSDDIILYPHGQLGKNTVFG